MNSSVPGAISAHEISEGIHHAHLPAMLISLAVAGSGILLAVVIYLQKKYSADAFAKKLGVPYKLSFNKFYIDEIYGKYFINPSLKLSKAIGFFDWDLYDKYFINGFAKITEWFSRIIGIKWDYDVLDQKIVDGVGDSTLFFGRGLRLIQTGKLQNYLVFALFGIIVIFVIQTM